MADSSSPEQTSPQQTSPEPHEAAAPGALPARTERATDLAVLPADGAAVIKRLRAPARRPLPDPVAIMSVAVPDAAPPYDGARAAPEPAECAAAECAAAECAAAECAAAECPVEVARAIAAVTAVTDASRASVPRPGQGQFTGHWPSQFAQVLAETLAGSRPPNQLTAWTTHQTRRRIGQLGRVLSTAHQPRVRRVIVTSPAGGVLEMAVIVGLGTRVRALAVRLERPPPAQPERDLAEADDTSQAEGPSRALPFRPARQPAAPYGW